MFSYFTLAMALTSLMVFAYSLSVLISNYSTYLSYMMDSEAGTPEGSSLVIFDASALLINICLVPVVLLLRPEGFASNILNVISLILLGGIIFTSALLSRVSVEVSDPKINRHLHPLPQMSNSAVAALFFCCVFSVISLSSSLSALFLA